MILTLPLYAAAKALCTAMLVKPTIHGFERMELN